MDAARVVEGLIAGPALVFGSLPPEGRDVDLLVRPAEQRALEAGLPGAGFGRRGLTWARFAGCGAEAVEIVPASDWALPESALDELFAAAEPVEGFARLVRPAGHHALLIMARRLARDPWSVGERQLARVRDPLSDRHTYEAARALAPAWRLEDALDELERRAAAREPETPRRPSLPRRLARVAHGRHRGALIALSGLDGSGKSTQAEGLARALDTAGIPAVITWTQLRDTTVLGSLAGWGRRLLALREGRAGAEADAAAAARPGAPQPAPGADLVEAARRERHPRLYAAWAVVVAAVHAYERTRTVSARLRRGETVICDRWTLDALVHLRFMYGARARHRLARLLLTRTPPRPTLAYLLEVDTQVALERKPEYTAEQASTRARLYHEEAERLGITVLDASAPREELCTRIVWEVWEALGGARPA